MWHRVIPATAFAAALPDLAAAPPPRVAFFNASPDPRTRAPWCPDCARSATAVRSGVAAAGGSLLEVEVGGRSEWKGVADHPSRVDPPRIAGVPTLVAYDARGSELARVGGELESAASEGEAARVVAAWLEAVAAKG